MKLELQVASLELSKKLKELGVKQESAFYWNEHETAMTGDHVVLLEYSPQGISRCSAFTVAELGEMLPWLFHSGRICGETRFNCYVHTGDPAAMFEYKQQADTEANARAKMLIYLLEQGILKPVEEGGGR